MFYHYWRETKAGTFAFESGTDTGERQQYCSACHQHLDSIYGSSLWALHFNGPLSMFSAYITLLSGIGGIDVLEKGISFTALPRRHISM